MATTFHSDTVYKMVCKNKLMLRTVLPYPTKVLYYIIKYMQFMLYLA